MAMEYFKGKVKENIELVEGIYSLVVEHEAKINAGQFYMIKTPNTFLGRPISVCEVNGKDVRFVYATVGSGTNEMKKMISGDEIEIIGPLGNGFDLNKDYGKVALVSGGIGTAPMVELAKSLRKNNKDIKMDFYGGFRDDIYLVDDIAEYVDEVKKIDIPDITQPTLSIGFSDDGSTNSEKGSSARTVIDIALGRGGDQAIVKMDGRYQFFGGRTHTKGRCFRQLKRSD